MKKVIVGMILGIAVSTSVTAFGAEVSKQINAIFGRVNLVIEGQEVDKETVLIDGTTYVPLRAAGELLGYEVSYDGTTQTAYLDAPGTNRQFDAAVPGDTASPVVTGDTYASLEAFFENTPSAVAYMEEIEDFFNDIFEGDVILYVDVEDNDLYFTFMMTDYYEFEDQQYLSEAIMELFFEGMGASLGEIAEEYQQFVNGGDGVMVNLEIVDPDGDFLTGKSERASI